jgi:hypothetical protein
MLVTLCLPIVCVDGTSMGSRAWDCPIPPAPWLTISNLESLGDAEMGRGHDIDTVEIDGQTGDVTMILEVADYRDCDGSEPLTRAEVQSACIGDWTWDNEYPIEFREYIDDYEI